MSSRSTLHFSARQPRERVVRPGVDTDDRGNIVIRDQHGVIRFTSSPIDRPRLREVGYDVNVTRLVYLERMIEDRYQGPCDCDGDVHLYLSAGLNAKALSCRKRGWRNDIVPLMRWVEKWLPCADMDQVRALAEKVIEKPRKLRAATVGRMTRLSASEWRRLGIRTIHPFDLTEDEVKSEMDAVRALRRRALRHANGARTMDEIKSSSLKDFCARNGLSLSSFYNAKNRGPIALQKFLHRKGVSEPLPQNEKLETDCPLSEVSSTTYIGPRNSSFQARRGGAPKGGPANLIAFAVAVGRVRNNIREMVGEIGRAYGKVCDELPVLITEPSRQADRARASGKKTRAP